MVENLQEKTLFNLFHKQRIYRDKTLNTIYFKSNEQIEKKTKPIDIDGVRYKLDIETGEIDYYTKMECINSQSKSLKRTKILLNMLLEMNDFDWFCTLTFDKAKIDRTDDKQVYHAYKKYIDHIKKKYPLFRYISVPERHKDMCIHFHLLIGGLTWQQLGLVNSGKVCCSWVNREDKICSKDYFDKTKEGKILTETDGLVVYNVTTFAYGFTTATRIASRERCNSYVKKYIDKALGVSTDIFKKRFFYSSNLKVPEIVTKLIGADFETPSSVLNLNRNNEHLLNAKYVNFNNEYNILQFWEENSIKESISEGLIPIRDKKELELINNIFPDKLT